MSDFKELNVWQKSHELSVKVYKTTLSFPKEEVYGLTSQIRRACFSISANIAEGCGRGSKADFARFLQIAIGSASELEYYFILCNEIGLLSATNYKELSGNLNEIKRMLISLIQKIKQQTKTKSL